MFFIDQPSGSPRVILACTSHKFIYLILISIYNVILMTQEITPSLIFEDDQILAINKPHFFHSTLQSINDPVTEKSIINYLLSEFSFLKKTFNKIQDYGMLNRLDFETSGILIIAKNLESYTQIKKDWKTNKTIKTYRALVSKKAKIPLLPFIIQDPISQRYKSSKKVFIFEGKMKNTQLKKQSAHTVILKQHPHLFAQDLEIQIHTGVRHQIRAHLSFHKMPIHGDSLYGGIKRNRLYLHAWKVKLPHLKQPIECPLPENWGT